MGGPSTVAAGSGLIRGFTSSMYSVGLAASLFFCCQMSSGSAGEKVKCDPDKSSQFDLNVCAAEDMHKADDELNALYKKALADAAERDTDHAERPELQGAVAALKSAERAWIDYRNGNCKGVKLSAEGGSMTMMVFDQCIAKMTRNRIEELKVLMDRGA